MRYERVHLVWDYYDGNRTGIADLNGKPHYFDCQFDEEADDYSENFKLCPVGPEFMLRAMRNWEIYLDWEHKFRHGEAEHKSHPGFGGINAEYDELKSWLKVQVTQLQPLPMFYKAKFRGIPGQEGLPSGMFRQTEVLWSPASD